MKITWHKSQVLLAVLISFMAGVTLASFNYISETILFIFLLIGVTVLALSAYQKTFGQSERGIRRRRIGFLAGALILFFTFGVFRFNEFASSRRILLEFANREVGKPGQRQDVSLQLIGYVDGPPEISGTRQQFSFRVRRAILSASRIVETNERTLVTTDAFPRYSYGEPLLLNGSVKTPQNFSDFDYVSYLKKDGIHTVMSFPKTSVFNGQIVLPVYEKIKIGLYRDLFSIRDSFERAIDMSVPEPAAAYLNGILIGTRQNIPSNIRDAFARTSTSHILAISGYNIMIIAESVLMILIFVFRRRTAFWISIALIVLFTLLTGASASVVRAAVMGLLLLFASGYGRLYDARNGIVLAGALMLLANPMVLRFDAGFQMSFMAVIGLLALTPVFSAYLKRIPKLGGLKEALIATLSAQIFVLPLLLYYFHTLSLAALPVNMLVLPLVPAAMGLGFIAGAAGMIWVPLGRMAGWLAWAVAEFQLRIIIFAAGIPWAVVSFSISGLTVILLYATIIFIVYWQRRHSAILP